MLKPDGRMIEEDKLDSIDLAENGGNLFAAPRPLPQSTFALIATFGSCKIDRFIIVKDVSP